MSTANDRLLSVLEVCERLGVSRRTLERHVAEGKLEKVKLGHLTKFRESDVRKFVENLTN